MKNLVVTAMLVAFIGLSLSSAHAETYKIYEQKMPPHWQKHFGDILNQATQFWQNKTPGLKFEMVQHTEQSDFVVEWASQYDPGKMGYYSEDISNYYGKPKVGITLGFFQDGKWTLIQPEYVLEITKHELGHAIGLPHSTNPNDIMYPQIEDYDSWLKSKTEPQTKASAPTSTDWKEKSTKYQERSDQKLYQLKSELQKAEETINSYAAANMASKAELDKAWNAFWAAKKHISDAELVQQEADSLFYASSYQESYHKYKSSLDGANTADADLLQMEVYLNNVNSLQ
ncbi:MAG: matrixin family metalloprotease [Nitrososphaerota archaeon]